MYEYQGKCVDVYDGDTITVDIDLGFYIGTQQQKLRLYGINAPEIRTRNKQEKARGYKTRDWLKAKILGKNIRIRTIKNRWEKDKKGKYGRWLAHIHVGNDELSLNRQMVELGLAVEKVY